MSSTKTKIPEATRRAVAERYGCEPGGQIIAGCFWCPAEGLIYWHLLAPGRPSLWVTFPGLELDHLIPESKGGTHHPDNIVLACRSCNRRRKNRASSLRPHVRLAEDDVSRSLHPHARKGREGKRKGRGGCGHSSTSVEERATGLWINTRPTPVQVR